MMMERATSLSACLTLSFALWTRQVDSQRANFGVCVCACVRACVYVCMCVRLCVLCVCLCVCVHKRSVHKCARITLLLG